MFSLEKARVFAGGAVVSLLTLSYTPLFASQAPAQAPSAKPADAPAKTEAVATSPQEPQQKELDELRRRIDLLAAEIEQLRSGETQATAPLTADERRKLGLGPSAASVHERKPGVSIAGYGEMLYENFDDATQSGAGGDKASQIDLLRAIIYTGYRFTDRILFNSEIEFEHGGDEVAVEFAYLDFRLRDNLSLRGGNLLVPLGLVNEFHEPNVFIGARRPETERRIIPSTWHENGFGAVGTAGPVNYRAYLVNGFRASGFTASGLRGGRQGGAVAVVDDWGFAGRLDVTPVAGVFAGVGLYTGNSGQNELDADVPTTIFEVHAQGQIRGFDVRGLFARSSLGDVAALNAARGLTGTQSIGSRQQGGYVQVAYNLLSQRSSRSFLSPYYRYERLDTQLAVPAGYARNPANDATFHTLGVEFKPIDAVVVKTDYQWITNQARSGRNQFNVALGYAF